MRTFPLLPVLYFLIFYLLFLIGATFSLKKILSTKKLKPLANFYFIFCLLLLFTLFYLYIYPNSPRTSHTFRFYLYFNILLFVVITFNLPASLFAFLSIFLGKSKKSTPLLIAGVILGTGFSMALVWGSMFGSKQIKIEKRDLTFNNLPPGFNNFRIVQLSDYHLGGLLKPKNFLSRIHQQVIDLKPDLLLFTGDFVNNFSREFEGLEPQLKAISDEAPTFSILGNHDYGDYSNWESPLKKRANFDAIREKQQALGYNLLCNQNIVINCGEDSIYLAGVENWGDPPFPQYADLEKALEGINPGEFTILMTHDPAHWQEQVVGQRDIALTFSGHTHGMQWGIKIAGIPFSVAWLTRKHWGGLYHPENSYLYVNTGIGTVGMPWRLDMPAEITLITLKRGEID